MTANWNPQEPVADEAEDAATAEAAFVSDPVFDATVSAAFVPDPLSDVDVLVATEAAEPIVVVTPAETTTV